ncbi:TetR family transcriptional regulator [Kribbella antibiotica]|uniref:TetR family transcriptional regulator n=1 Tax=Kribbella antibiotica TaxID=190195 RepID=A0A4R4ZW71_9ACTN|nr:TetR family transcriptional regulator [Kribbella antibiotica]TDD63441.1 TetR family transcriptional regulator [Kribbella antibiotica]
MARWDPDAEGRLRAAALELFQEHGFENVTAAQIAERAGLARRSFFRYFPDKREVLFAGSEQLPAAVGQAFAAVSPDVAPWPTVLAALDSVGALLVEHATDAVRRREVIQASPELRERERTKSAAIALAIQTALEQRAVPSADATLLAHAGTAVFQQAFTQWVDEAGRQPIETCLAAAAERLERLIGI